MQDMIDALKRMGEANAEVLEIDIGYSTQYKAARLLEEFRNAVTALADAKDVTEGMKARDWLIALLA